ncbi:hypothetical protein [Variovorax sp. GB1P17]|uniref:hypothetical protein n=1 Tax=Variovorax sp. GB1P17 TaxID=3443740 RepID=UPI003F47CFE1
MADPTVIDCSAACTVTVVHELSIPPFQLSLESGLQISVAVIGVWALGWALGLIKRQIQTSMSDNN